MLVAHRSHRNLPATIPSGLVVPRVDVDVITAATGSTGLAPGWSVGHKRLVRGESARWRIIVLRVGWLAREVILGLALTRGLPMTVAIS
jgi:hypothetical protein